MSDLLKAIQIFLKYGDPKNPFDCSHDVLRVSINCEGVSEDDIQDLAQLGFDVDEEYQCFKSFRFGSG